MQINKWESIKEYIMPLLIFLLSLAIGMKQNILPSWIVNLLTPEGLTALVLILIILTLYLSSSLYQAKKLTLKFGILWDKYKEPYCPACRNPLSNYRERTNLPPTIGLPQYTLRCVKCNKSINLPMCFDDTRICRSNACRCTFILPWTNIS